MNESKQECKGRRPAEPATKPRLAGSAAVAAGIFLSRIAGFARESIFAHYFGNSWAADAFKGALRIPNLLQNLLGEGVLSASFVPVYSSLRAQGKDRESADLSRAVFSLLLVLVAFVSALGVSGAGILVDLITPGFSGEKRELAIQLVRIFFPGTAILVISAWCLGVLNSHRRFFLSYVAPVVWNLAIILSLVIFGGRNRDGALALWVAWGLVVGSVLQCLIQIPTVWGLIGGLGISFRNRSAELTQVVKNFFPVVFGRGIVQISAFIDSMIASFLPTGAVSSLSYGQMIYLLPVSLFAMSIAAAELPEMSSVVGSTDDRAKGISIRIERALPRLLFFVLPSAVAFILFGDVIIGALYQSGRFTANDTLVVWLALIGMSAGLLGSTMGRLYSSAFYALFDTKTPLKISLARVMLSTGLGAGAALYLPSALQLDPIFGVFFLTIAGGLVSWIELFLLKFALEKRIPPVLLDRREIVSLCLAVTIASVVTCAVRSVTHFDLLIIRGGVLIGSFGIVYGGTALLLGNTTVRSLLRLQRK